VLKANCWGIANRISKPSFDALNCFLTSNLKKAYLNQVMIEVAREVIIETNSSRFLRKNLAFLCKLDWIDAFITDTGISKEYSKRLEDAGIKVINT
jgi:DeoR family transcriptional regulator, aga operon transcriptional repressor